MTIQNEAVFEGSKSLKLSDPFSANFSVQKTGTLTNDGRMTIYVQGHLGGSTFPLIEVQLKEGDNTAISVKNHTGRDFSYYNGDIGSNSIFGPQMASDTWYALQIEWRSSDHTARYRINDGNFTNWKKGFSDWLSGLDTVNIGIFDGIGFVDAIQENFIPNKTPVLIVPGLVGTEIKKESQLLWPNIDRMSIDLNDSFLDDLQFNKNLSSLNIDLSANEIVRKLDILLGLKSFDYSDGLINEFNNQGYVENETLFTFPYDWRYGVTGKYPDGKTNTDLLAQKISDILSQTGAEKVDVISHSMGGLIVKDYVVNNSANHHINKTVFVGVPNIGSPKAVKTLVQGDNLDMFFVNQQEIKKIAENMPAMYDLSPSREYYNKKGSYVTVIDQGISKDLNYDEENSFLINDHALNSQAVLNAEILHSQNFDNFDLRTVGIDTYAIDGCKAGTFGKIIEARSKDIFGNQIIKYKKPEFTLGDGTVPLESSTNFPIDVSKKYYALQGNHSGLLSHEGTKQEIVNIISGSNLAVSGGLVTQNIDDCKLNGKAISVYSPIDINVVDQQGNVLGLADDGSITNTIPNAAFEVLDDHKFIYLPTDDGQTYQITMQGTGEGVYTITIDTIAENTSTKTEVFSNLPVTTSLTGNIALGENDLITVKENPNSQSHIIPPSLPEAVISFNPVTMDLVFEGADKNIDTTIDNDDFITILNEAGDNTEINLKSKNRKKFMQAEIKSIKYNGVSVDISKNKMKFEWSFDKNQKLKKLIQSVKSKKNYTITTHFDGINTKIVGKDASGKIDKKIKGLVVLKVSTEKGDLKWSY